MSFVTFSTIHCSDLWNLIYCRHIISVFFSLHKKKLKKMQMNVIWRRNCHWSCLNQEMPVQVMVWKQYIVLIMYIWRNLCLTVRNHLLSWDQFSVHLVLHSSLTAVPSSLNFSALNWTELSWAGLKVTDLLTNWLTDSTALCCTELNWTRLLQELDNYWRKRVTHKEISGMAVGNISLHRSSAFFRMF